MNHVFKLLYYPQNISNVPFSSSRWECCCFFLLKRQTPRKFSRSQLYKRTGVKSQSFEKLCLHSILTPNGDIGCHTYEQIYTEWNSHTNPKICHKIGKIHETDDSSQKTETSALLMPKTGGALKCTRVTVVSFNEQNSTFLFKPINCVTMLQMYINSLVCMKHRWIRAFSFVCSTEQVIVKAR